MDQIKINELFKDALDKQKSIEYTNDPLYFNYFHFSKDNEFGYEQKIPQKTTFKHTTWALAKDEQSNINNDQTALYTLVNCRDDFMENYYPTFVESQNTTNVIPQFMMTCPMQALIFFDTNTTKSLKIKYIMPLLIANNVSYDINYYLNLRNKLNMINITCAQMQKLIKAIPTETMPYLKYSYKLTLKINKNSYLISNGMNPDKYYVFIKNQHACPQSTWKVVNNAINSWLTEHITSRINPNKPNELEFVIKNVANPYYQKLAKDLTTKLTPNHYAANYDNDFHDLIKNNIYYFKNMSNKFDIRFTTSYNKIADPVECLLSNLKQSKFVKGILHNQYLFRFDQFLLVCKKANFMIELNPDFKVHHDTLTLPKIKNNTFDVVDPQEKKSLSTIFNNMEFLGINEKIYDADHKLSILIGDDTINDIISQHY